MECNGNTCVWKATPTPVTCWHSKGSVCVAVLCPRFPIPPISRRVILFWDSSRIASGGSSKEYETVALNECAPHLTISSLLLPHLSKAFYTIPIQHYARSWGNQQEYNPRKIPREDHFSNIALNFSITVRALLKVSKKQWNRQTKTLNYPEKQR